MKTGHQPAALIVDLCGTLILENTTNAFLDEWLPLHGWRRALRRLSRGKRPISVLALRGLSRRFLYQQAASYVRERLRSRSNSIVVAAIAEARRLRIPTYLATASIDPVAFAVGEQLQLEGVVCSRLRYHEDRCSGVFAIDVTGSKLAHLRRIVPDSLLSGSVVYTDNREDTDLMQAAAMAYFFGSEAALSNDSFRVTVLSPEPARGTYVAG